MSGDGQCQVLIVDDDENDIFFLRHAMEQAGVKCPVQFALDGEQAISYLSGEGAFADRTVCPIPDVMFLDLKMPLLNGFGVLEWIKTRPELSRVRVFVLTGSYLEKDRTRAMQLGAADFFIKPATPQIVRRVFA